MTKTTRSSSTQKVRRDARGGKRGNGHERADRVERPDPERLQFGEPDGSLTSVAGLAVWGRFLKDLGVDRELHLRFGGLEDSVWVRYPMESQLRLLLDANVVGETRVFGLEALACDPLFVHSAGGVVPSIDTVYRDLERFHEPALAALESMMARHGMWKRQLRKHDVVHLDIDTTVEPLFGSQQGAHPGPNPRYQGRPSYHPILARVAELGTFIGAVLRPGDTALGEDDVGSIREYVRRVQQVARPDQRLYTRLDAAGDCTAMMAAIAQEKSHFLIKARLTWDLVCAVRATTDWQTIDTDADDRPTRQVAEVSFAREQWRNAGLDVRVIAVRTSEDRKSHQLCLWEDLDFSVKVYLTSDFEADIDELAHRYEDRAEIEHAIGELKRDWGIHHVPSRSFGANHAMFLLELLAYNLVRRFVRCHLWHSELRRWSAAWLRRVLWCLPGRLIRSARQLFLRPPANSLLARWNE